MRCVQPRASRASPNAKYSKPKATSASPTGVRLSASFRAPSLFSSRRLVEVRLPSGKPGKEGAEVISDFCADPPQDVTLLITAGEWSKQHGGKWSEAIGRIGQVAIAWAVKPHELADWIERRLRARGLRADRDAVQNLADRVEGNLLAAAQEIDKLALLSDGETLDSAQHDGTGRRCRTLRRIPPGRRGDERAGRAGLAHARRPARRRRGGARRCSAWS